MTRRYVVPGRVELVGKHVDYAGGRSLTCAVDLALHVRADPLSEPVIHVRSSPQRGLVVMPLDASASRQRVSWSEYVAAVARRFARDFPHFRVGVDIEIRSDLPASAGLSSSSALVVAVASALADVNNAAQDRAWNDAILTDLVRAEYFAAIETGSPFGDFAGDAGVGVRGGAQDPIAIIAANADAVTQFSYLPARLERRVDWPSDYVLAIGVSGVHSTKTGNSRDQYNRAADAMRSLATEWNVITGRRDETIADALASSSDAGERLALVARNLATASGDDYLVTRLAQFREESEIIVPSVGDALRDRNFDALGSLVDRSQALAEQMLNNQVAETIALAHSARELGAVAASAFGAGFGGSVWAIVQSTNADVFIAAWRNRYAAEFPNRMASARWLVTRPSNPFRVSSEQT
ncbi:MAG TPA: galactokinase family protein [Gemmatimonadaceae bacterium]|nr:galactokinase family protein [Gemmatimonadaceae bacterium]